MTAKMEMKQMEARDMNSMELMNYTEAEYERCIEEFGLHENFERTPTGAGDMWGFSGDNEHLTAAFDGRVTSQKALGILRMCRRNVAYGADVPQALWMHLDITDEQILWALRHWFGEREETAEIGRRNLFIRSCPDSPRPGVLDSFHLDMSTGATCSPIMELRDNMRELDPNGCIMIMSYYPATHSATLSTEGHLTVGHGNNGVTAGNQGRTWSVEMNKEHIGGHDNPTYLEYIEKKGENRGDAEIEYVFERFKATSGDRTRNRVRSHFVQYRAAETGPLMTEWAHTGEAVLEKRTDDAFPAVWPDDVKQVTPTSCLVVHSLADVSTLEAIIEKGDWPNDFVVFAPNMSTASHAACTARAAGIPYFKTHATLNKTISQCGEAWDPKPYWGDFLRGVSIGYKNSSILIYEKGAYTHGEWLSVPFHQFVTMPPNDAKETATCAGAFVGWLLKAATAVAVGETRHKRDKMEWNDRLLLSTFTDVSEKEANRRGAYYENIDKEPPNQENLQAILEWCEHIFEDYQWGNSYGGKAYAVTVRKALKLLHHLTTFQNHATKANFNKLITAVGGANGLENAVHNCGFFFDKFANKQAFDVGTAGFQLEHIRNGRPAILLDAIDYVLDGEHEKPERNHKFLLVQKAIESKTAPVLEEYEGWETVTSSGDYQTEKIELKLALPDDWDATVEILGNGPIPVTSFVKHSAPKKHKTHEVTLEPSPNSPPPEPEVHYTDYEIPWHIGQELKYHDTVEWVLPAKDLAVLNEWCTSNTDFKSVVGEKYTVFSVHYQNTNGNFTMVNTTCGNLLPLFGCKIIPKEKVPEEDTPLAWWQSIASEIQELIPKSEWLVSHIGDE